MALFDKGMSEKDFLRHCVIHLIENAGTKLQVFGFDKAYMDNQDIRPYLRNAVKGVGHRGNPVSIKAILSESDPEQTFLDDLAQTEEGVWVRRMPHEIRKGYMISSPQGEVYMWDCNKETTFKPEKGKGVPYREHFPGYAEVIYPDSRDHFETVWAKLEPKSIEQVTATPAQ